MSDKTKIAVVILSVLFLGSSFGLGLAIPELPPSQEFDSLPQQVERFNNEEPLQPQDLGSVLQNEVFAGENYNFPSKLRDNVNSYTQVWNPWITNAGVHVSAVSDDGEFLAVGGGYLIDDTVHIYRWNIDSQQYEKVYEAGAGVIQSDIMDIAFGDTDNNDLLEIAVASADGRAYLFEQAHIFDPFTQLDSKFDLVWQSDKMFQVSSVEISDIDLDNLPDLIVGAWDNRIHVFEYVSHSGYPFSEEHWIELEERWTSPSLDDKIQSLEVGDINGNGLPDFVAGTLSGSVYVYENDGIVVEKNNVPSPFPNDNNYAHLWNSSNRLNPIWNIVGDIFAGELNGNKGDEYVILGWGQGAWVLQYSSTRGFFFEQLIKPFESWQTQGMYPLDNWADFMQEDEVYNVYPDLGRVNDGTNYPNCDSSVREPNLEGKCYTANVNSGGSEAPDGVYSRFISNGTHGAQAIWDIGEDEEIASNGNDDPDVYIVMKKGHAIPSEWNISVSNDKNRWYQINQSQLSVIEASSSSNIAIDIDPLFAYNKLSSVQYIRLLLNKTTNGLVREIDAIVVPYVAQPLTLAVTGTIDQLYFDYDKKVNQATEPNKIIFGGTDGRLIVFAHGSESTISYRNPANISDFKQFDKNTYAVSLPEYSQSWDSFTDDQFNLDTTIWSIYKTSKKTFIPSWRYIAGSTPEFSVSAFSGTEKVHHVSNYDLDYFSGNEVIVTTNNTANTKRVFVYDGQTQQQTNVFGSLSTDIHFANVNTEYGGSNKILTLIFGDFIKGGFNELITVPWYSSPSTLNVTNRAYDSELLPILWEISGTSSFGFPGTYVKSTLSFNGNPAGTLEDKDKVMYSFLDESITYPSGTATDVDEDGDMDLILSNGKLILFRNVGTSTAPEFQVDPLYFEEFNQVAPSDPIYSPQAWDYDRDGDFDIIYSYGIDATGKRRYGVEFISNIGTLSNPEWKRTPEIVKNPTAEGGFKNNEMTYATVSVSDSKDRSASGLWIYKPKDNKLFLLDGETGLQNSFVIGTNPEVMKLEVNKLNTLPLKVNMGYTITSSWSNGRQFDEWTTTLAIGELDGDNSNEVVVADFDNNLYVFEHLNNNTYKRAFKSHNLNHTESTSKSPYKFQDLDGVDGTFERVIFDHASHLITDFDGNSNGLKEFLVVANLSIYIFEATGFNDEYRLMYERDIGKVKDGNGNEFNTYLKEFSSVAVGPEFDGRGTMIALASNNTLFLLRYDPAIGWVESYQGMNGVKGYGFAIGDPSLSANIDITSLLFGDLNQDGTTELWVSGINSTVNKFRKDAFLVALTSNVSNVVQVFSFPELLTKGNIIYSLKISEDMDYDGKLELLIGHEFGIDIWEFEKSSSFLIERVETISSDPSYSSTNLVGVFGDYHAPDGFATRRNDIFRISSGQYVVVYGNETDGYRSLNSPFTGSEEPGVLWFDAVSDPANMGAMGTHNRVSTETFDPTFKTDTIVAGSTSYRLVYETLPSIAEVCSQSCPDGFANTFVIAWISVYRVYSSGVYQNQLVETINLQRFHSNGTKIGTTWSPFPLGNYAFSSVSIAPHQTFNDKILMFFVSSGDLWAYEMAVQSNSALQLTTTYSPWTLAMNEFYVHSIDMITNPGSTANSVGVAFSGYAMNATLRRSQLYYLSYNSTLGKEGVYKLHSGVNVEQYPSLATAGNGGNRLVVTYEVVSNSLTANAIAYSSDNGRTWSDSFELKQHNPNLIQMDKNAFTTKNGILTLLRKVYRPTITFDGMNGFRYIFVERFLLPDGVESNYAGAQTYSFLYGINYDFVSQLWLGGFNTSSFFNYPHLGPGLDLAVGDSDRDMRQEILMAHGSQATLLELDSEVAGQLVHTVKWQSKKFRSTVMDVEIFDANGNEWAELLLAVKGGTILAYEVTDLSQIPASNIVKTTLDQTSAVSSSFSINSLKTLIADVNGDGVEDLNVFNTQFGTSPNGGVSWNISSNTKIRDIVILGNVTQAFHVMDSRGTRTILVSEKELKGFDENWNTIYHLANTPTFRNHNALLQDFNNDGLLELLILTKTTLKVMDPINGSTILSLHQNSGSQYYDLSTFQYNGTQYYAWSDSDFVSYRKILLYDGMNTTVFTLPVSPSKATTVSFADFNNDGFLDPAVLDYNYTGISLLTIYSGENTDLTTSPLLIANITLSIGNAGKFDLFRMELLDVNGDNTTDIILPLASPSPVSNAMVTVSGSSSVVAINALTQTVLWRRDFNGALNNFAKINDTFVAMINGEGAYALYSNGMDAFWAYGKDPTSVQISNNQVFVTDFNGTTYVSSFTGKVVFQSHVFKILPSVVNSKTLTLYGVPSDQNISIMYQQVDATGNSAMDLLVGMSNGTLLLRNFAIGEYWRMQTHPFAQMAAHSLRYGTNRIGVAVSLSNGQLLIFDRITPNIVLNETLSLTGNVTHLVPYSVGTYDYVLMHTTAGHFVAYDPVNKLIVWSANYALNYDVVLVGAFDYNNPGSPTHIIAFERNDHVRFIPLPSTLLNGGLFTDPSSGKWIDLVYTSNEFGLASLHLISTGGELSRFNWKDDGTVSSYSLTLGVASHSLDVKESQVIVGTNEGAKWYNDTGSSFNLLTSISLQYQGYLDHKLTDVNGDGNLEAVVMMGTQIGVYNTSGNLLETHSFSSPIRQFELWIPDTTGNPVFFAYLSSGDLEISDPAGRQFSTRQAPLVNGEDINVRSPLEMRLPAATWPPYNMAEMGSVLTFNPFALLMAIPIAVAGIRRWRKS